MSVTTDDLVPEMPKPTYLDQLRAQHAGFMQQKELAQNNLNQLVGAIFACEQMIARYIEQDAQKQLEGVNENGGSDNQTHKEQAA